MILLQIDGLPTPWAAARVTRRGAFNPKCKEKEYARWQIKAQYNQQAPLATAVRIEFTFHMPIPTGTSKVRRTQMLNGRLHHIKKPDTTNLQKFAEDVLKGLVIDDDSQVIEVLARKIYSERPQTIIKVESVCH